MPWENPSNAEILKKIRDLIFKEFDENISAQYYVATREELIDKCLIELREMNLPLKTLNIEQRRLKYILGKYFPESNEIWVVESIGEVLDIFLHESLHSIQKCFPNTEGIVDYLTYRITKNSEWIDTYTLQDWLEIEKSVGFEAIKRRLLAQGDCEDF